MNRVFLLIMCSMMLVPIAVSNFLPRLELYDATVFSVYLYLIPALLYAAVSRGRCLEDISFRPLRLSDILLIILFSFLLLPVVTWINMFSMLFSQNYVSQELQGAAGENIWKNLIFIAVLPAVAEEYVTRGILFHGYRKAGILKAAIISGLLFGLMHLNLNQFCYAAVLGTVFALLVEATGSIFSSMIAHFTINLNSVLLIAMESAASGGVPSGGQTVISRSQLIVSWASYTVIAALFGALAFAVFVWITKRSGRADHMLAVMNREDAGEGRARAVTPALMLAVGISVLYMILFEWMQ